MKPLRKNITSSELSQAKKIINHTIWYRQATASCPLYIATPAIGVLDEFGYPGIYCQSQEFEGYYSLNEFNKTAKEWIAKCRTNPNSISEYYQIFHAIITDTKKILRAAELINLTTIPLKDLCELLITIDQLSYDMWYHCFLVDKFDPSGDQFLKEEINKENISLSQEEINDLIRPQEINFIEQSNLELCKIALHLKHKKNWQEEASTLLKQYLQKWFFIQNSWGKVLFLKEQDFLEPLQELLNESAERLQERIQKYENLATQTKQVAENIIQKHELSKELQHIFHLFRILAVIRDERKEIVLRINHFNEQAAQRLAKEFDIDISLLRRGLPQEIATLENEQQVRLLLPLLQERDHIFYLGGFTTATLVIGGEHARELILLMHKKILQHYEELKGMVACKGPSSKIQGKVKIILGETHFSKFEDNDILVAPMTRPEYVPLMKRAKAVITDEGGITCHAAIVSRELNVPCIIGTGVATKKLFDNRQVEIDTEKGVITLI